MPPASIRGPGLAEASTNVGAGADGDGLTQPMKHDGRANALADGASRRTSWECSRLWNRTSAVQAVAAAAELIVALGLSLPEGAE